MFAPELGVPEDPVTGAAHTMLIPYWLSNGLLPWSTQEGEGDTFVARQVSKRGGELRCSWDRERGRVGLEGRSWTVGAGELNL